MMAELCASNSILSDGMAPSSAHDSKSANTAHRFSGDDDDASDDPAWYAAPHSSLQASLPMSMLKKHSTSSMTSSTDTASSSNPSSPQQTNGHNSSSTSADAIAVANDDTSDDYFPPEPHAMLLRPSSRRSMQIPVSLRSSRTKASDTKRISLQRKGSSNSLSSSPILPTSPLASGSGTSTRQSLTFDMRSSFDASSSNGSNNNFHGSGYRESMMRYRPSDLNTLELKQTLATRDSLAVDATEMLASSRGSVSHFGARQSELELPDFLRAARTGNLMLLRAALQDATTDVTERDAVHGQSALHIAVRFGQFAAVKLLCQRSKTRTALLDSVDNRQNTPLHLAAAKSRRITKFLLEHGASVTHVNSRNQTALGVHILTSRRDEPLIAEMLLQHRADPNAALDASTLLHRAVDLSLYEIAYRLVRHGARLDLKDEHEKMVFDKVNRKTLRQLFSKIAYPPVWVPDAERSACMLCARAFSRLRIGVRRHHCRHCGRLCCGQCSHVSIETSKFPKAFEAQVTSTNAAADKHRVCKTCSAVFHDREAPPAEPKTWSDEFVQKVVGCTWEEIETQQPSGQRRSSVV